MSVTDDVQEAVEQCVSDITNRFKELIGDEELSKEDTVDAFTLFTSRVSAVVLGALMDRTTGSDKLRDILLPYLENFRDVLLVEGHKVEMTAMVYNTANDEDAGLDRLIEALPWGSIKAGGYSN